MEGDPFTSSLRESNNEAPNSPMVHTDGVLSKSPVTLESRAVNINHDQMKSLTGIGPNEVEYKTDYTSRGKALIFNHKTYDNKQNERFGTESDMKTLQSTFQRLGFQLDPHNDLTLQELQSVATAVAAEDHSHRSCLVVVVMTHGEDSGVLNAKDKPYNIDMLLSCFFANRCPSLISKPKIFIIQACRGNSLSEPCTVYYDTRLATTSRFYSIPAEADILLAFSTYQGSKSHRNRETGSWFIQELCKELNENASKLDMVSMLTNVTRHVAIDKYYLAGKQIPVTQSTLTRKLFLYPSSQMVQQMTKVDPQATFRYDSTNIKIYNTWQETKTESIHIAESELPEDEIILKIRYGLKLFLKHKPLGLKQKVWDSGEEIMLWMSRWDILDHVLRCHTYNKLLSYLQSHAKDWEYYNLLYIPTC